MRQLIRGKREKEPHLSCRGCSNTVTFTGLGWAALVWGGSMQGVPGTDDRLQAPGGRAGCGWEATTQSRHPLGCRAATGACSLREVP